MVEPGALPVQRPLLEGVWHGQENQGNQMEALLRCSHRGGQWLGRTGPVRHIHSPGCYMC